jgi:hypothetical protein
MDSVRFGRALGFGARSAAKALITAVDAASSPSPAAAQRPAAKPASQSAAARPATPSRPIQTAARTTAQVQKNIQQTRAGVAQGSKRLGTSVWRPFVKLSGVLWLEMTGSFFALFALFAAQSTWTHRADFHQTALNHTAHQHLLLGCGVTLLFTYFAVSSFLKAHRRSHSH